MRFDWPNDSPLHTHMTFEKLVSVVSEHASGIRASDIPQSTVVDTSESPADAAKRKARETLLAAQETHEDQLNTATQTAERDSEHAAPSDENPGELLRRELQQAAGAAIQSPFGDMKVQVSALTSAGLIDVDTDAEWEEVKRSIADTVWLEGCLRVICQVESL